jgi:hypothetical protein
MVVGGWWLVVVFWGGGERVVAYQLESFAWVSKIRGAGY